MDNELNRTTHDTLTHLFNLQLEHLQVSSPRRYFHPLPLPCNSLNLPFLKQFSLSPDPYTWGTDLSPHIREPDDYLHTPDPHHLRTRLDFKHTTDFFSVRAMVNLGGMLLTCVGLLALLYVLFSSFFSFSSLALSLLSPPHFTFHFFLRRGDTMQMLKYRVSDSLLYPISTHFTIHQQGKFGGFNLGGINASGQVRSLSPFLSASLNLHPIK